MRERKKRLGIFSRTGSSCPCAKHFLCCLLYFLIIYSRWKGILCSCIFISIKYDNQYCSRPFLKRKLVASDPKAITHNSSLKAAREPKPEVMYQFWGSCIPCCTSSVLWSRIFLCFLRHCNLKPYMHIIITLSSNRLSTLLIAVRNVFYPCCIQSKGWWVSTSDWQKGILWMICWKQSLLAGEGGKKCFMIF